MSSPDQIIREISKKFPMPKGEIERLQHRRWVLQNLPKGGVGAEIGVFRGHFSEMICEIAAPRKLYLIDPWTMIGETFGWGKEYTSFGTLTTVAARDETIARTARFPKVEAVIIEGSYPACAGQIAEPLDFAYLDASHMCDPTLRELRALDKQVKPDGFILGDDWDPRVEAQHHGVFQAVQIFVAETDWEIIMAGTGRQWILRRKR